MAVDNISWQADDRAGAPANGRQKPTAIHAPIPKPPDKQRSGLKPARQERAVAGFWWRHPLLVQVIAITAVAWGAGYLVWRVGWSGSDVSPWLFWSLLAAEMYGVLSLASYAWLAWHAPPPPESEHSLPSDHPTVDVFVTTYDEPIEIVEPTLLGCMAIRGDHTTYLLDDGRRPEMRELAVRYGARYVERPDNSHAKAGNVNHALTVTDGELILMLDADHVPMPNILAVMLGYFADPSVAVVQTPHEFSNRDSAQHRDSRRHEQSLFYDVIAPNKDRHNAMFWCGSATLIRRLALLDVGGVLTKTVAEDFHTTIAMHAAGWRTRYDTTPVVQGRAPHDLAGFLLQRARWARGNLAVFRTRQNPLWCPGLTIRQRLSYFCSLFGYFNGLQRLVLLGVLVTVLASGELPMHANLWTLFGLWLPWSLLAFVGTLALGRGTLSTFDSTRFGLMTMGVQIRGVFSLLWPRAGQFKVTPKEGIDEGGIGVLAMLPLLVVGLVAVAGAGIARLLAVLGVVSLPALSGLALVMLLLLAAWESFCILKVLVPLTRRRQLRQRYRLSVDGKVRVEGRSTTLQVLDISTSGLALLVPVDMRPGARLRVLTRLPDARGEIHDVTLPIVVHSCRPMPVGSDGTQQFHLGAQYENLNEHTRRQVLEYCSVAHPAGALGVGVEPEPPAATETELDGARYVAASPS